MSSLKLIELPSYSGAVRPLRFVVITERWGRILIPLDGSRPAVSSFFFFFFFSVFELKGNQLLTLTSYLLYKYPLSFQILAKKSRTFIQLRVAAGGASGADNRWEAGSDFGGVEHFFEDLTSLAGPRVWSALRRALHFSSEYYVADFRITCSFHLPG